jgi:hypothetical protein
MSDDEPRAHTFAKVIQELCERPPVPLSVEEQRRRYRQRRRLPDWAWGIVVGLLVSGAVVATILLVQNR